MNCLKIRQIFLNRIKQFYHNQICIIQIQILMRKFWIPYRKFRIYLVFLMSQLMKMQNQFSRIYLFKNQQVQMIIKMPNIFQLAQKSKKQISKWRIIQELDLIKIKIIFNNKVLPLNKLKASQVADFIFNYFKFLNQWMQNNIILVKSQILNLNSFHRNFRLTLDILQATFYFSLQKCKKEMIIIIKTILECQ
ncbi:hypothetical protein FGO68_gene1716 [Halteria grandinella]|uniref:Uncharacterized protein n=1 Tax=Halteria grandinella TaxID=5974 RepID=A0A8J8SY20_HALGN|nr:hypothetical protein FGO68_gene1716 [Halteria grandinella]